MKWTDGSVYQGDWFRGIQHGVGKMIFPDGTVKEGCFEYNVYKGPKEMVSNSQNDLFRSTKASSNFYQGPPN
jgi:hypothetical protein